MGDLSQPTAALALAALAVASVGLIYAVILGVRVRRMRAAQTAVLGGTRSDDLVAHAARLQQEFEELQNRMEGVAERLDRRMGAAEEGLSSAVAHRALVRYDAYGELAGKQSISLALLDARRNGVVLSSIAHRDTARLYCKPVTAGEGQQPLSPEEQEAVRLALQGSSESATLEL